MDSNKVNLSSSDYPNILNWMRVNNRLCGDYVSNHVVIWIDILGYKNKIESLSEEGYNLDNMEKLNLYLQKIMDAYEFAIDISRRMSGNEPKIKIFSDNILLYSKLYFADSDYDNVARLMFVASSIQWVMIGALKMLVRGAATIGLFYSDDIFVYGPALVEAYKLESGIAKNPRIVISDNLLKYLEGYEQESVLFDDQHCCLLRKDEDNRYSIDVHYPMYLSKKCLFDYGTNIMILKDEYKNKEDKLKGMMNYVIRTFNEFCEKENIDLKLDELGLDSE